MTFISKIGIEVVTCEFLLTQLLESFIVEKGHRSNHMCYKFIYYHIYYKKKSNVSILLYTNNILRNCLLVKS